MNVEAIGIAATTIIVAGFMYRDAKKIRVLNAVGSALYVVYGIAIHSISNILLNSILIFIHVYVLRKSKR